MSTNYKQIAKCALVSPLIVVPLIAVAVVVAHLYELLLTGQSSFSGQVFGVIFGSSVIALMCAYPLTILLGLPIYFLARSARRRMLILAVLSLVPAIIAAVSFQDKLQGGIIFSVFGVASISVAFFSEYLLNHAKL